MKRIVSILFIIIFLPISLHAYKSPGKPQGFVSDYAKVIDQQTESELNTSLQNLSKEKGIEIAVVTVNDLDNDTVENFAVKLFEEWGIGNKENDSGILFLIAPNERQVRIEVGYGMESTVTDLISNQIIQKVMIPRFKEDNYSQGIKDGVLTTIGIINKTVDPATFTSDNKGNLSILKHINPEFVLFFIFMILSIFARIFSRTKSWWLGGFVGAGIGVVVSLFIGFIYSGFIVIVVLALLGLLFDFIVSKGGPKNGGGFWFGSGGTGGFGGFGGGRSGGGGSSGSW
jgi:uncharacterized protein